MFVIIVIQNTAIKVSENVAIHVAIQACFHAAIAMDDATIDAAIIAQKVSPEIA